MQRLLNDFNIPFQTEGHKHCRPGWLNMACPFCTGNPGLHLGYNTATGAFYCWRCGWHPVSETVAGLLRINEVEAKRVLKGYKTGHRTLPEAQGAVVRFKPYKVPSATYPMASEACKRHRKYLTGRRFDSEKVSQDWGLLGTGPVSLLDGIKYAHRIIAPIVWNGVPVSFQGRDITGKSNLRYQACPKARENIHHKHILYKTAGTNVPDFCICVEGITDVWRLGPLAVAVFGIEYTSRQVRVLAKMFKRVTVLFDDDPQAIIQGEKLVAELAFRGVKARQEIIEGDPGAMQQDDAEHLVKEISKWK